MDNAPGIRPKIEQCITNEQAGQTLEQLIVEAASIPQDEARELLARGAVWLNRRRVQQADIVVQQGSELQVHFPPSGTYDTVSISAADILWEDEWLLALNKQPGWHANYTPWDTWGTIPFALAAFLRDRDGSASQIHLAHQLDRDTSGILLISKHAAINPGLQQLFLHGNMGKTYLALASGVIEQERFEVTTGHGRGRNGLFRVYPLTQVGQSLPFGKQRVRAMQTHFAVIARQPEATLVQATPITGRTHQIRLHLAHVGHPIVGDARYGGQLEIRGQRAAHHLLHAARLAFVHPLTLRPLQLAAPLPPSWLHILSALHMPKPDEG